MPPSSSITEALRPAVTPLLAALPSTVPFVAPDALERRSGRPLALRLGANESSFGTSPKALAAMRDAIARAAWYGDPETFALRARLAARLRVRPSNLAVGAGVDDLLGLVVRCFVSPGDPVVMSRGGYPTFAYHVAGFGGVLHTVPYRDDRNDLDGLAEAARRHGARLCYLSNPDNPSGSWHSGDDVRAFLDRLPPGCLLLLDEAYLEFGPDGTAPSLAADDPRVVRTRTFSKLYGMAGARIGYAIADETMVATFDKVRHHFGVNAIAQAGALAALDDAEHVARTLSAVAEGRRDYGMLGAAIGMPTLPSGTNFVCFDAGGAARARALVALPLEHGVFIRMPGAPPLDRCVRITVGTAPERAELSSLLRRLHAEGALAALDNHSPRG